MQHNTIPTREALLASLRRIAGGRAETVAEQDADGAFPFDHIRALREAGILSLTAPVSAGGQGSGLALTAEVIREIGYSDPSAALVVAMHLMNLATLPSGRWAPDLLADLLASAVKDGALINALRVEPDLGTPLRGGLPATTAHRYGAGWRLSGRKIYSTGSEGLGWGLVWARTDEEPVRTGYFLVPMNSPGIRVEKTWDTLGLRGSSSHDVIFEDVVLPARYAADLRPPQDWAGRPEAAGAWGNLLIAALYTGVAEAARDWITGFLNTRIPANLGRPLSHLPRQQEAVGRIEGLIAVNNRLIRSLALEVDSGSAPPLTESSLVKLTATENAIAAVEGAMKLAGNHAIARRNPLERHYRDVLCGRIHSPQEDMILTGAGKAALGL